MRGRLSLALSAILVVLAVVATTRRPWSGSGSARPVASADSPRDTMARPDSAAPADSALVEDPPCLASRVGLPCR